MKWVYRLVTLLVGVLLLWASADFPDWGDPGSPASSGVSTHYIETAYEATHVPNLVSAILADYRNYDTMLETTVVFTAGTAILLFLGVPLSPLAQEREGPLEEESEKPAARDLIVETACRILFPAIQIFALYVLAHGHYSPGGGFQAGVILASSYILMAISFDLQTAVSKFPRRVFLSLAALGVLLYVSLGLLCLVQGGNFFDYGELQPLLGVSEAESHSLGILGVEIGVTMTVCAVIFYLYVELASGGREKEGL